MPLSDTDVKNLRYVRDTPTPGNPVIVVESPKVIEKLVHRGYLRLADAFDPFGYRTGERIVLLTEAGQDLLDIHEARVQCPTT